MTQYTKDDLFKEFTKVLEELFETSRFKAVS